MNDQRFSRNKWPKKLNWPDSTLSSWRLKVASGALIGALLAYLYAETASYPVYEPPASLSQGVRHVGIVEQKNTYKWSDLPYRLRTSDGVIKWGCAANHKYAANCPKREVWDKLIGKQAVVVLLPTPAAKIHRFVILQMSVDGKTTHSFTQSKEYLAYYAKQDPTNRSIEIVMLAGALAGGVSVVSWIGRFKQRKHVAE